MIVWFLACDAGEGPALEGAIGGTISSGESSGQVIAGTAFAAELGGNILFGVFPETGVSCDDAAAELTAGDARWNPSKVQAAGACSMSVFATFDTELSLIDATLVDATVSVSCAMDTGEWEHRTTGEAGWYYSGPWWQGSPEVFSLNLTGDKDAGYQFSIEMDTYSGQFIYDLTYPEPDPGTGAVSGAIDAAYCDHLIAAM